MRREDTSDEEAFWLWYELGGLYSQAAGDRSRAVKLGFTVTLVAGALVLISTPLIGTAWAGPFAAIIPVAAGLASGVGLLAWRWSKMRRRVADISASLEGMGWDVSHPAREGLGAYYDPQLILLRSEYEYLRLRGFLETARLFEESFGFRPEDSFETGPLNVAPDTRNMRRLREGWERRLAMRRERGMKSPPLGLREDRAYRVFPREMTVPAELAARREYLEISRGLIVSRYGRHPLSHAGSLPEEMRQRVERDLGEYAALTWRL